LAGEATRVRTARAADAAALAAIYNAAIEARIATFETERRTAEERAAWLGRHDAGHPVLVAEMEDVVVGFASVDPYRTRACYAGVGEFSVYVAPAARRTGVGRRLMLALIERCAALGYWKILSRVFVENAASRGLLRSVGFREVGVYERHARLDGVWRDVVIVERLIEVNMG
jgi:phosphinothricin acetyltransferase